MEKHLIKPIVRFGNSAGVLLPKEWLNGKARVELIEKPLDINSEVLEILSPYLSELLGVYLFGSYSRGDQDENSDVDILAISKNLKKEIHEGKYNISIYPLENLKRAIVKNPLAILPKVIEAKAIFNNSALIELKNYRLVSSSFDEFVRSSKRILKINEELFNIDKKLDENNIYSLILRLRGFYLIRCLTKNKIYSKEGFSEFLISEGIDFKKFYEIYRMVKSGKNVQKFNFSELESFKLIDLLRKEINQNDK